MPCNQVDNQDIFLVQVTNDAKNVQVSESEFDLHFELTLLLRGCCKAFYLSDTLKIFMEVF